MTTLLNEHLNRCLHALLGNDLDRAREKNGIGFNRFDGDRARDYAARFPEWKPFDPINCWSMLQKYRGQLQRMGIELPPRPPLPEKKPQVQRANLLPVIDYVDGQFALQSEYNETLLIAMKQRLRGRHWDGENKRHLIPANQTNLEGLLGIAEAFSFLVITPAFKSASESILAGKQEAIAKATRASSDFKIPGLGMNPRPFQAAGIEHGVDLERVWLCDDMGLGKTLQTLGMALVWQQRQEQPWKQPLVVITPANLKWNWVPDILKALPDDVTVGVIEGRKLTDKPTPSQKRMGFPANKTAVQADVILINYDLLSQGWFDEKKQAVVLTEVAQAIKDRQPLAIGLDESHYIKNEEAQRTIACFQMREGVQYRVAATGTPIENRPVEAVAQLMFLDRISDFGGPWQFKLRYCDAKKKPVWQKNPRGGKPIQKQVWDMNGASNMLECNERLKASCMIRRTKKQVLHELPDFQRIVVNLDLDNWKEYLAAEKEVAEYAKRLALASTTRLPAWMKERGIVELTPEVRAAFAQDVFTKAQRQEALAKFNVLKQIASKGMRAAVEEWLVESFLAQKEQLILFCGYQATQHHYLEFLKQHGGAVGILGDTSKVERLKAVESFQKKAVRNCVASIWAAAEGLNLQNAQDVVFPELPWNPSKRNQAEARVHRIGQTENTFMWYLIVPKTIYEDIYAMIEDKAAVAAAMIDGVAGEEAGEAAVILGVVERLARRAS